MKKRFLLLIILLAGLIIYQHDYIYQWGYRTFGCLKYDIPIIEIKTELNYLDSLIEDRENSIADGWITLGKKDFVPTRITVSERTIDAEYRLKGDYLHHITSDKWSYRVQTNDSILGLQKFSLHHPIMRNNINEIFWQYICHREGLIRLDYDIVQLKINNDSFGLYAIEESFGKNFCSRKGLNGFVIRFKDKEYWRKKIHPMINSDFSFQNAEIDSYNTPVIRKDSSLWQDHEEIVEQLHKWVQGISPNSKIFNLNKFAKYFALADLCSGHHGLIWFNMRLYYNPKTKLLEPIAFDGDLYSTIKHPIIINSQMHLENKDFYSTFFLDSSFIDIYHDELEKFSSETYFKAVITDFQSTARKYQNILNLEFPRYKFNTDFIEKNAFIIQEYLRLNPE
tara:strand:- start:1214 stop:2398 length:1185 start_codon:yes stop_codon:yes gene_type:complete